MQATVSEINVKPAMFLAIVGNRPEIVTEYGDTYGGYRVSFGDSPYALTITCYKMENGSDAVRDFLQAWLDYCKSEGEKQTGSDQIPLFDDRAEWEIPVDIQEAFKR